MASLQVLITGKIGQAAVLSVAAYEDERTFQQLTGIEKSKLVIDKNERNTHVCLALLLHDCVYSATTAVVPTFDAVQS